MGESVDKKEIGTKAKIALSLSGTKTTKKVTVQMQIQRRESGQSQRRLDETIEKPDKTDGEERPRVADEGRPGRISETGPSPAIAAARMEISPEKPLPSLGTQRSTAVTPGKPPTATPEATITMSPQEFLLGQRVEPNTSFAPGTPAITTSEIGQSVEPLSERPVIEEPRSPSSSEDHPTPFSDCAPDDILSRCVKTRRLQPVQPPAKSGAEKLATNRLKPLQPPAPGTFKKDTQKREAADSLPADDKQETKKNKTAKSVGSAGVKLTHEEEIRQLLTIVREIVQRWAVNLKKCAPAVDTFGYFEKAMKKVESELRKDKSVANDAYWLLYDVLQKRIMTIVANPLASHDWSDISLNQDAVALLSQWPCKIFYFALRLLALILYVGKEKMQKDEKIQFASTILQIFRIVPRFVLRGERKICDLDAIFQHSRKHELKESEIPLLCHKCFESFNRISTFTDEDTKDAEKNL